MREMMKHLLEWWCRPEEGDAARFFHPEVLAPTGDGGGDARELVAGALRRVLAWQDVVVVASVVEGDSGALFFEGRDPITLLWYRNAWLVRMSEGKIANIHAVAQIVGSERR